MIPLFFRTVYTYRYVQIESTVLGLLYFGGLALIVVWSFVQCFFQHSYVKRPYTYLETTFWRYSAVDGNWWFQGDGLVEPTYCNTKHWWGNDSSYGFWGSDNVSCRNPESQPTTFVYPDHNLLKVATSVAYGNELNSTELYFYKHIEKTSIVFQINFYNEFHTEEVKNCRAFNIDGIEMENRWPTVAYLAGETNDYIKDGFLMLSVEDILGAAGRSWDSPGKEWGVGIETPLPLRLQGIELIGEVQLYNYHQPFIMSNATECIVRFKVFRDQFTEVHRFYRGDELIAVQNGLRMRIIGSASLGYPSFVTGLQTVSLGLAMFSCISVLVELIASIVHPRREEVNAAMCHLLPLDGEKPKEE